MLARLCGVCIRYNDALYTLYYCVCIWLQLSGLVFVLLHVSVQHIYVFLQVAVCITVHVYALSNNAHNVCVFLHVSVCLHSVNVRFVHVVGGYNCE